MASDNSFDVVSQFDRQELVNAIDQAVRELNTRYDLKNTGSQIVLEKDTIGLSSDTEFTLKAVRDVLLEKAVRRGLSPKLLDFSGKVEPAARGTVRQTVRLRHGIDADLGRQIVKIVRDRQPKLRAQVQGEAVRISGASKDQLHAAIKLLREQDYAVPLQFTNYR
jgi:cyclic-di-GMP-binding protein